MTAIEELQRVPCPTCRGKGIVAARPESGGDGTNPCPACQEDGAPTGLRFPWLTEECFHVYMGGEDGKTTYIAKQESCEACGGTSRASLSPPQQLWALLDDCMRNRPSTSYNTMRMCLDTNRNTRGFLEALAAAVLEGEKDV